VLPGEADWEVVEGAVGEVREAEIVEIDVPESRVERLIEDVADLVKFIPSHPPRTLKEL